MSSPGPATSQQAVVEAALVLLERMGLSPADLVAAPASRPAVPTFAEYVPVVSATVSPGTRRAYGSYWNRLVEHWGGRRLDEPTPSEVRQLMTWVKTHVVARRNARGGRSAQEHLVAALRCLYRQAERDGLIAEADNPARKVDKPRRLPSTRRAVADTRPAEINQVVATTGNDPELDTLLLRLHTETACRRGGALALRPADLDPDQCLILLREKGETVRWQPVSPTLMAPLPGSPFAAGGAGLGTGLASQGAIQATPDGRYLLAVDAGSNQISVLRITAGGVPVPVGQPVSSGGIKPVSVAVSPAGLVYVANSGAGGSGYSGFRLHADGSLTPIPGSTVTVPDSAGLGDVFFNAFGNHLVGTRTGTSQIDSFVVLPGGHLLAAKGSPFTGQGLGQLGAEFSPASPSQLFVSNAHNGAGLGTVSAYHDSLFGQLTPIGASPYADGQTAPCWVEISRNGKYLFVTNTASGNISGYAINPAGSLTLIGTTAIKGGGADIDERLSPDGRYLLVDGSGNHILSVFAVSGGNLTEVASSPTPLPAGGSPAGIVNI